MNTEGILGLLNLLNTKYSSWRNFSSLAHRLSGLSPFLGDDDSETLNNVLTVNWYGHNVLLYISTSSPYIISVLYTCAFLM